MLEILFSNITLQKTDFFRTDIELDKKDINIVAVYEVGFFFDQCQIMMEIHLAIIFMSFFCLLSTDAYFISVMLGSSICNTNIMMRNTGCSVLFELKIAEQSD